MAVNQGSTQYGPLTVRDEGSQESALAADDNQQEMIINAWSNIRVAEYQGTRAQLEAEGIIPKDFKWPFRTETGYWQLGKSSFSIGRHRPPGLKGPMKLWTSGDWWRVRWNPADQNHSADSIRRKTAELAAVIHHNSAAGIAESNAAWARYDTASNDQKFQSFKALILSLVPTQSRRKLMPRASGAQPG